MDILQICRSPYSNCGYLAFNLCGSFICLSQFPAFCVYNFFRISIRVPRPDSSVGGRGGLGGGG